MYNLSLGCYRRNVEQNQNLSDQKLLCTFLMCEGWVEKSRNQKSGSMIRFSEEGHLRIDWLTKI